MERMFTTHLLRKSREAAPLWEMATLDAGGLERAEKAMVPSVWESHPRLQRYRGRAVYEQRIECGGNVRLWFGGVSFHSKVWLDDALLCGHYGAYTGFEALARGVEPGMHTLRVEADNRFDERSALHVPNDYYAYGGINRPVVVEEVPDAYITQMHVTPRLADGVWHADTEVWVRNLGGEPTRGKVCVVIGETFAEADIDLPAGKVASCVVTLACPGAAAWEPSRPALYLAQATLLVDDEPTDDLNERFGFREIRVEGKRILLNNQPLRLKGFNRHEEAAGFGLAVPVEAMLRDIRMMQDMGANCVRTCHYPNDPRFLDLCDELGMLVWEESHARGLSEQQMRHPLFLRQTEQCTREMVAQHYNHPSIFIWGCLNECADDCEYGADCFRRVFRLLDELDASRPMTAALLERPGGLVHADSDVVSVNLYPGWYLASTASEVLAKKYAAVCADGGGEKPFIVSEIGAGAIYGYHDPLGESKWSEERQCSMLEEQLTEVLSHPDCTGVFLWQFADVRVCEEWAMGRPRTFNNKGVVDEYRRPKLAYALVKRLFETLA